MDEYQEPSPVQNVKAPNARTRVLQASLRLFNEAGTASISTNHIAEAAGISVGNLYYHFKNKEEIILALYMDYANQMAEGLVMPSESAKLHDLYDLLDKSQQILWKYRFFLRESSSLIHKDPELNKLYLTVRGAGLNCTIRFIEEFIAKGVIIDLSAKQRELLALAVVFIGEELPRFLESGGNRDNVQNFASTSEFLAMFLKPYTLEEIQ